MNLRNFLTWGSAPRPLLGRLRGPSAARRFLASARIRARPLHRAVAWRNSLAGLVLVAVVGGLSYVGYRWFLGAAHGCDVCGRELHAGMRAAITLEQGRRVEACCPRCALHFAAGKPEELTAITVEDSVSGEALDARAAVYVEGSDVEHCASAGDTVPREPGVFYERIFDRCLPSLIAFKTEGDARAFQREHGGRVLSFAQASEHVRHR